MREDADPDCEAVGQAGLFGTRMEHNIRRVEREGGGECRRHAMATSQVVNKKTM